MKLDEVDYVYFWLGGGWVYYHTKSDKEFAFRFVFQGKYNSKRYHFLLWLTLPMLTRKF